MTRKHTTSRLLMSFMLFIMLLLAIGNYFFASYAFNRQQNALNGEIEGAASAGMAHMRTFSADNTAIIGHLDIRRIEDLHYALTLTAEDANKKPLPLKSFSCDVRLPGGSKAFMVPVFKKTAEATYEAEVTLPYYGPWDVRARMLREHESLEFYERFEIPVTQNK
ncbi:MAG: hypothetical protein PW788_10885 [Micavibrio sp.]|nr:hypothetical protein [Micavibrio sp.]